MLIMGAALPLRAQLRRFGRKTNDPGSRHSFMSTHRLLQNAVVREVAAVGAKVDDRLAADTGPRKVVIDPTSSSPARRKIGAVPRIYTLSLSSRSLGMWPAQREVGSRCG